MVPGSSPPPWDNTENGHPSPTSHMARRGGGKEGGGHSLAASVLPVKHTVLTQNNRNEPPISGVFQSPSSIVVMMKSSLLSAIVGVSAWGASEASNDWPIIGMFTQPSSSSRAECGGDCLYLAASYVKEIESSGARVVPINYYSSEEELDFLFESLNGFFFVGGGAAYPDSAQYIFDKTVAANDAGDYMPLWGTCMGFQWLLIAASRDVNILDPKTGQFDAYNLSIPLDFTESAASSYMFRNAPKDVYEILATEDVTMNNHHYGIYTDHFLETDSLTSFFDMLSTNKDRQGVDFVSTIEAFKYPIFGTQWHPEKNTFEWDKENGYPYEAINHSPHAVHISQWTGNFFVDETRKNDHKFSSDEEEDARLIYNYPKTRSGPDFVETYYFAKDFSLKKK